VLCLYLLLRPRSAANQLTPEPADSPWTIHPRYLLPLAAAWFPVRLLEEANPDWRLVSWAMAVVVVALTLTLAPALARAVGACRVRRAFARRPACAAPPPADLRPPTSHHRSPDVFPILFFLVAVPWPTLIETPLIQALTRFTAGVTVETLALLGIPALAHGNLIEVAGGLVGLDQACSGIRSLQAVLMLSLFFGETHRLTRWRRGVLICAALVLALACNTVRTGILTLIAARHGPEAIGQWHDPAGVTILLLCFLGTWTLARRLRMEPQPATLSPQPRSVMRLSSSRMAACAGLIVAAEIGVETWYRLHENRGAASPPAWHFEIPSGALGLREIPLTERTRRILRYDHARQVTWQTAEGYRLHALYLQWDPGRTAIHLARSHTPEQCFTAAGFSLKAKADRTAEPGRGDWPKAPGSEPASQITFRTANPHPQLPFREYTFTSPDGEVRLLYCLWDDVAGADAATAPGDPAPLTWRNRFGAVLAGRRNPGQRSLAIAIWASADDPQATRILWELPERLKAEG